MQPHKYLTRGAIGVLGSIAAGAMLLSGAPVQSKDFPPAIAKLLVQAKKEGEFRLTWTSMGFKKGADRFEKGFNAYYGLKHKFQYSPGPHFAGATRKLAEELAAGKPAFRDISLIAGSPQVQFDLGNKTSMPVDWASLVPHLPADLVNNTLVSPDKRLITFISQAPTIMYNTNVIKPADAPKSFKDLLNPKWKGMIASTPYAANFEDLVTHPNWRGDKAREFVDRFSNQLSGLIRCAELDRIASGEFPLFVTTCEPGLVRQLAAKGAPVAQNIPRDWRVVTHRYFGTPVHAVNPASSQLFIAWVLTPEGQKVLWTNEGADLHYLATSRNKPVFDAIEKEIGKPMIVETIRKQLTYHNEGFKKSVLAKFRASQKK